MDGVVRPVSESSATARREAFRHPLLTSWFLGSALAAATLLAYSRGDVDRMVFGDGQVSQNVAAHLTTAPADVHPVVAERGTSLRYGRIGLPIATWIASAGRPAAMRYAQPAVIVVAAGAVSAATMLLLPGAGLVAVLLPFLAVGFLLSILGGYAEVLGAALALWAIVFGVRGRWLPAVLLLAAAMLTRENAGGVVIGLAVWSLIARRPRRLLWLAASLVPVAAWHLFVLARFGHLPLLDPYLRVATDTIGPPFLALWRSITQTPARSAATAALHLAVALVALRLWRSSPIGAVAAATAIQVFWAGPFAWHFIGDATRVFTFLQLFTVLAVAEVVLRRRRQPQVASAPA
jgi:hypothetical protein